MKNKFFQLMIMTGIVLWIGIISPEIFIDAGTGCLADENGNSISRKEAAKVLENYFLNSENRDFNDDVEVVFKFKLFEIF